MVAATGKASAEVEEYRAWHRPWGFVPAEVTVPVTLWRGEQDRMVTAAMVDQLAAELPAARLRTLPGVGHLLPAVAGDAVLDDLLGPA